MIRCISLLLIGVIFWFGQAALALAQTTEDLTDLPLEELLNVEILNASRSGRNVSTAAASISVLTASEIRAFGWRTLAEAMNAIRGIFSVNDRSYTYLGVRGFWRPNDYNSRILLAIDGQRMNDNAFDGSYYGQEFLLDMDLIERIEFIPGSGSSVYGTNAFLGMINVVTKNGQALNGAQVSGEAGSYDSYKGRFSYGKKLANNLDMLLSGSYFDSAGVPNLYFREFDSPETNNGIAYNLDGETAQRLLARVQYRDLTLEAGYVDRFKQVPTASYGAIFNDPGFFTVDKRFFTTAKYQTEFSEVSSLILRGFYQGYEYFSDEPYDNDGRVVNHDEVSSRWWGGEVQFNTQWLDVHKLMLGLEYQYDDRLQYVNYDFAPYALYQNSNRQGHRVEVYLQDDIRLSDEVIFSAGARLDYHHMLKHLQLNPKLGLIWTPHSDLTLKALYSSTFRAPNIWERDYQGGENNAANPNNYEELYKSYEAIAEWRPQTDLKMTGNFFFNDIEQLLEQQTYPVIGSYGPFVNTANYQIYGFETEIEKRWDDGRMFKLSYTYNRMNDLGSNGDWAEGSPQHLAKLHYIQPLFKHRMSLGLENIFISERKTLQQGMAQAYDLINVNLTTQRLWPGLQASVGVYNLLDNHYEMLGGAGFYDIIPDKLPMNGREFRLKLQFTF